MFFDARQVENDTHFEVNICIVGGGAAGITLARELVNSGLTTILLEAGGTGFDESTQEVYRGIVKSDILDSNYLQRSRARYFGGTTNLWGGHSVVINPNIFRSRAGLPGGEWPITEAELRPYYKRAADSLGVKKAVKNSFNSKVSAKLMPMERYPVGKNERRFGTYYYDEINRSNTKVLLNASVTAINPNRSGKQIDNLTVQTLTGNKFFVRARIFVLAAGGIENAKLLLLPTKISESGTGNHYDLVGRRFTDHLFGRGKLMETNPPWKTDGETFSVLTPQLQDEFMLPEMGVIRRFNDLEKVTGNSIMSAMAGMSDGSTGVRISQLSYYIEVLPIAENRVMLGNQKDPFGNPRTELRFHATKQIRNLYTASVELFARITGQEGIGRVQLIERKFGVGNHHMNTTPMSNDPSRGVVDSNSKVHGVSNLFVAGSSVFPSSGCGNPTFPLISLTYRLADHLKVSFKVGEFT